MDNMSPVIVGLGEILWDMFGEVKQMGGAPSNFAYHAHKLGAEAYVASRVGEDGLGREILGKLEQLGLSSEHIQTDKSHPTGTVSVELDDNGQPCYIIHEDTAWDYVSYDESLEKLASKADAVCFGSLCQRSGVSRKTIRQFLSSVPSGCLRVFDINLRQHYYSREIIIDSLQNASVFKLNDQELPVIAQMLSVDCREEQVFKRLFASFPLKLIALTRGGKGSLLVTPERVSEHPGIPAEVVDTVGAGDSFTAAVTVGLLRGYDLDRTNELANRVASYVCTCRGGTPEIPGELVRLGGS